MELEQASPLVQAKRTPSPTRSRRGRSPRHSRSKSPHHSVSVRSPSHTRRSTRRRSPRRSPPRRSPPRRSPPRRNERSWSPSSSEDNHDAQNDRNAYGPFTRRIRDAPIPRGLENPPQMDSYDGTTDLDEYIENIEVVLTYRSVRSAIKCKLFVTTLRRGSVTWFKNLWRNSIDSWSNLYDEFTTHFTTSRTQPKTVASLEAIVQRHTHFPDDVEVVPYSCTWEQFPVANVITGGTMNISMGSMKRKFEELMSVNLLVPSNSNLGGRPPLAFYDSEWSSKFNNSFARSSIDG